MNLSQIKRIYECADAVYKGRIDKQEAKKRLYSEFKNIKETTHEAYLNGYLEMLKGEEYHRNVSAEIIEYYLLRIKENYGISALGKSLSAIQKNILYQYKGDKNIKSNKTRKICQKIADENNIDINFDDSIFKNFLKNTIESEKDNVEIEDNAYNKQNFLKEVFMTPENYDKLYMLLKRKKNIILQGAPGVGKTYAAKRLAYSLIGAKDDSKIEMVQFHQNYSYEDFVMGYRPSENGFNLQKGVFYEFCQKARNDLENDYYFIIDEINRGNLSSIFGELLMLIESDYRDVPVTLVYKKEEKFSVPHNVYIIGMMNTADRSIAMIDYALRRRFSFFTMHPGFETAGFKQMQQEANSEIFNELIKRLIELNKDIAEDTSLGEGFCIGHSYFVYDKDKPQTGGVDAWLKNVIEYDICPMIDEYWFDDKDKANWWKKTLLGVFDK